MLIFSLWVVFALRAHNPLAMPAFVDESLHILRGQIVFDFVDPRASILPAKLLLYYYLGLFGLQDPSALWVARVAVALLAPLAAALSFGLTRHMTRSFWAGLLVVWLYALSPFMLFFERLALADPFALVFVLAAVWASARLADHPEPRRALWVGLWLGLALLAKLTTLPVLAAPLLAMLLWRGRIMPRPLFWVAGLVVGMLLLPASYAVYQELFPPENKSVVVEQDLFVPEDGGRLAQIEQNLNTYADSVSALTGAPLILFALALGSLFAAPRAGAYVLGLAGLLGGFIVVATAFPTTRYLLVAYPLILVGLGSATHGLAVGLWQRAPGVAPYALLIVLALGGGLYAGYSAGFIRGAWDAPERLTLGAQDEWEYFSNISSGYGLREAAETVVMRKPSGGATVAGLVGNCHSLRLYFPVADALNLYCPYFPFDDHPALLSEADWERVAPRGGYVFIEPGNEDDLSLLGVPSERTEVIGAFARPDNGATVLVLAFEGQ
ncbi:MAG: glycosyltransferase family 39 protein [Anaerolineales bacterium]